MIVTRLLVTVTSIGSLTFFLAGCAAMDWGTHLASFKYTSDDKNDAVVLISAGSPETCGANPMSIRLLADGTHSPILAANVMGFNSKLDTSMYPDHQGVLMAMRVSYRQAGALFNVRRFDSIAEWERAYDKDGVAGLMPHQPKRPPKAAADSAPEPHSVDGDATEPAP